MAPEQAEGRAAAIGPATDVYALGATLYELLTGRPPFAGASQVETLDQVRTRDPVPPRALNPVVPLDVETVTLKCLHKDPAKRYPTVEALADDLDRWLGGRPVRARAAPRVEVAWRWCRRNPVVASLSTLLAAGLVGGLLAASWVSWRLNAQRDQSDAYAQAAVDALSQILETDSESVTPSVFDPETFIPGFLKVRGVLVGLVAQSSNGQTFHRQLARADSILGEVLVRARRYGEARTYFEECLRLSDEYLRAHPQDYQARTLHMAAWTGLGDVASHAGDVQTELLYVKQGIADAERLIRIRPEGQTVAYLASRRDSLAARLARRGDAEQAGALHGATAGCSRASRPPAPRRSSWPPALST